MPELEMAAVMELLRRRTFIWACHICHIIILPIFRKFII
jgi:hypothetical protein